MPKHKSLEERLEKTSVRVQCPFHLEVPCRVWQGYTQKDGYVSESEGYGRMNMQRDGRSLKFPVHRVAKVLEEIQMLKPDFDFYDAEDKRLFFELYDAYSLSGLSVDHLCRNSLCSEPKHLEWVHLSRNQQRKKWTRQKCILRIGLLSKGETRHQKFVRRAGNLSVLIRRIRSKQYRTK